MPRFTTEARLSRHLAPAADGCLVYTKMKDRQGYGRIRVGHKMMGAHRLAYELWVGEIPTGETIDHLCFNTSCCNPQHLRTLSHKENSARQRSSMKTECVNGHSYSPENTYIRPDGSRDCRTCIASRVAKYYARRKSA